MNYRKKIAKNTILQIILNIFNLFAGIFSLSLIARYLGKVNLGKYSFISSFYFFFFAFLDFGMSTIGLREVSREREQAGILLSSLITFKLFLSIFLVLLALTAANIFPFPRDLKFAISLYSPILVIIALESIRIIFEADLRYEYTVLASFFWRLSSLLFVILSIWLNLGLIAIIASFLLAELVQCIILFLSSKKFVKTKIPIFETDLWVRMVKAALPLGITAMFGTIIRNIDILLLIKMKGFAEVGLYTVAYRIYDISLTLPIALIGSVFPLMSKFHKEDLDTLKRIHQKTFDVLSVCGVLLVVLVLVLADKIIILLFGARFIESSIALRILIFSALFVYISIGSGSLLITIDKQIVNMCIFILCAIISISLNFVLIPPFGFAGAAISNAIVMFLMISLIFWFVSIKLKISLIIAKLTKAILAGAITAAVLAWLPPIHLFISIVIAVLIYTPLIFIMKAVDMKDLSLLFKFKG